MRESTMRGPAVDLGEFERRLRAPERKAAAGQADPLSELARLMQGEDAAKVADPYSRILAPEPRAKRPQAPAWPAAPQAESYAGDLRGSLDAPTPAVAPEQRHYDAQEPAYQDVYAEAPYQEPGYASEAAYHGAEGGWSDDAQYLDYGQTADDGGYEEEPRGWSRFLKLRPWHAVVAISLVGLVSIGWAFMHRSGSGGSRDIAVIDAPEGPVKLQPSADGEKTGAGTGATVLDRKESAPVKQVVTHEEQAVDPTVAPKAVQLGAGPVDAPHEPAPLTMTQPRKVKSVTVRPDGSRVENDSLPPAVAKATGAAAPETANGATRGDTPKIAAKPATTPRASKPKPPAPKVAAAEESAPQADAEAAPAPAAISKGSYAVQFGAANSEEEARALLKTVAAKYGSQLGGHRPTFKPAKVGDKMVYRVRVAGVSKESATSICQKVKSGGGACFVAGN